MRIVQMARAAARRLLPAGQREDEVFAIFGTRDEALAFQQAIKNASHDMGVLAAVVNGNESTVVETRTGARVGSIRKLMADIAADNMNPNKRMNRRGR